MRRGRSGLLISKCKMAWIIRGDWSASDERAEDLMVSDSRVIGDSFRIYEPGFENFPLMANSKRPFLLACLVS